MKNIIPYGRQMLTSEDIEAVVSVLNSDYITQGPVVGCFEESVRNYCGARFSISVNSATSALHIACLALGLKENDQVWTSPISFVASANCARYCGAFVDFVDIDPHTYNICTEKLRAKLELAEIKGNLPKVVIPVHLSGQSCDMKVIHELSLRYGFSIIEDASHALGASYHQKPVGHCQYSDVAIFSFHPVKMITTGEGGMALTNDEELARKMAKFRSHGITSNLEEMYPKELDEIWNYQQIELGFNYRMTDIAAALGLSQIKKLDDFVRSRRAIARNYDEFLNDINLTKPFQSSWQLSSYHLYIIRIKNSKIHKQVYSELHRSGVMVNLHYIPIYRQPYYARMGYEKGYCEEAEKYFSEALSIPIYPGLTDEMQHYVIQKINDIVDECSSRN